MAKGTSFGCQKWSGRTDFGSKSGPGGAKIGPAGTILCGNDFGVTAQIYVGTLLKETSFGLFNMYCMHTIVGKHHLSIMISESDRCT